MTRRRYVTALAATLIFVAAPLSLSAQRMARRIFINAVDAAGAPVLNLTAADLRVTENGNPREVTRLALGTAPMRIVLLVDSSSDGESRSDLRLEEFNRFVTDFIARGGSAHGVVVAGRQIGSVTDLVLNLAENAGGIHGSINTANSLPERLKAIAERLGADHQKMVNRYEVDFTGDAKLQQTFVNVGVTREGVRVEMSARRPF